MLVAHWNLRVVHKIFKEHNNYEQYGFHEVYYVSEDDSKPTGCTVEPVEIASDSKAGLKQQIKWMQQAIKKPVLDYDTDFNSLAIPVFKESLKT